MRIAIIGAGFTGLSAAMALLQRGQVVELFEAADKVGGLAVGFKKREWEWTIEHFYHHIFTNDKSIIRLASSVGLPPIFSRPITSVLWKGKMYPFDSPLDLLRFPGLDLASKLRLGVVLAIFKLMLQGKWLEAWTSEAGLVKLVGRRAYKIVWKPLLTGKFGKRAPDVNLAWFWARIKKRTPRLGTFPGGFQALASRLADEINRLGGRIHLNQKVEPEKLFSEFDAVLSTLPEKSDGVEYLDAHVLLLEMKKPFLPGNYWLNILDAGFPFLVLAEHTNFIPARHFANTHLLYVGSYLPAHHQLFSLSADSVLKKFLPGLKRINPKLSIHDIKHQAVFHGRFAQPIVTVNYSHHIPQIKRQGKLYVANQAMIYPWDRGTNYAVELGQRAAKIILEDVARAR